DGGRAGGVVLWAGGGAGGPSGPEPGPLPRRVAFVDGVRRVEQRLLVENGARTIFALLGSFGVGATDVEGRARVGHEAIGRVAVAGGGLALDPFVARIGSRVLRFAPATVPENTPIAPRHAPHAA